MDKGCGSTELGAVEDGPSHRLHFVNYIGCRRPLQNVEREVCWYSQDCLYRFEQSNAFLTSFGMER